METIRLTVEDMVTRKRGVRVPRFCPNCRADFRGPEALVHHAHALVAWNADVVGKSVNWVQNTDDVLEQECFPRAWFCRSCGFELASSNEVQLPPVEA